MKNWIKLVEIPATDFARAVKFYETVLGIKLTVCESCETEKMAFFSDFTEIEPNVAISWAKDFLPSKNGVLVSLKVDSMEQTLERINANGGTTIRPKTKIEPDSMGYFALFSDSEGNSIGLYADK